jgi:hypothetical protein
MVEDTTTTATVSCVELIALFRWIYMSRGVHRQLRRCCMGSFSCRTRLGGRRLRGCGTVSRTAVRKSEISIEGINSLLGCERCPRSHRVADSSSNPVSGYHRSSIEQNIRYRCCGDSIFRLIAVDAWYSAAIYRAKVEVAEPQRAKTCSQDIASG